MHVLVLSLHIIWLDLFIIKTVYLLRRKGCARFGRNFSRFLLCQVKTQDEKKNTRHVYPLGENINKPLVHFY